MGWFSNLFSNEALARAVMESDDEVGRKAPEPYAAVRTKFRSGEVGRQISIIRKLLLALPASPHIRRERLVDGTRNPKRYGIERSWPHRDSTDNLLNLLYVSLEVIDVNRSDMKTLLRIIDLCNETLPSKIRQLELNLGQYKWDTEFEILIEIRRSIQKILAEITVLPTNRSILSIDSPIEDSIAKDFPNLDTYKDHPELYDELKSLEADWDKAALLPLSAEDDYVIERVGNSYLPDALLLFDRFRHRTGSTNSGKALSMVKEQISLIHQQVMFVLEQNEEDNFNLMETHTEFLKMKNSRMGPIGGTSLQLNKKDDAEKAESSL